MGFALPFSCCPHHFSPERLPKEGYDNENVSLIGSVIEFVKPVCLWTEKKNKKKKRKMYQMEKHPTLEDWFLSASNEDMDSNYGGEHYVFKKLCSSDHPSALGQNAYISDSTEHIFSLEKLLKDEEVDIKDMEFYLLDRSRRDKTKKRVSLRLPEVADIFIIYSPEVAFEQ
ncbi:Phospholipase C [Quillaja saponaria]|uniref:Phospholipase C n=1 Tax=Quillaja saponaria TaxID=32244 RepID=A0AAD7PMC2_QUISA|nr:Phospholipase C [Quillaja saponaria]